MVILAQFVDLFQLPTIGLLFPVGFPSTTVEEVQALMVEAKTSETPILWPPDAKNQLNVKDPDAGKKLKAGGEGDDRG